MRPSIGSVIVASALGLSVVVACGTETEGAPDAGSSGNDFAVDDGSGFDGGGGCATTKKKAEKQPLDMVIGLDTSFSMDFDEKWPSVRDALKAFVGNPAYADLGIGLQFFPLRKQCSVADYEKLAVPLVLAPSASGPIGAALDAQQMAGGTPMVPLLEGLTTYLAKNAKPGRKPVIVLATDGVPDDTCLSSEDGARSNTLDDAVAVAAAALAGAPSISTFVIGVGGELKALDAIAAAGGTTKATLVDTGASAQEALLDALEGIRRTAIPCDYDIPPGTIDPEATNVAYTSKDGTKQLVFVGNEAGCAKAANGEGWYFDDEAAPKKVILCAAVCAAAKSDDGASVDLVFGCPRVGVN